MRKKGWERKNEEWRIRKKGWERMRKEGWDKNDEKGRRTEVWEK